MNPPSEASQGRLDWLWIALSAGLLFFFALGRAPLGNPDEGRYAEIPREMVASGDWVTPRLNGVAYFEKPPLVYWFVALALKTFGSGEAALRATPALFGILGLLLTYAVTRGVLNRIAALWTSVVLGTSIFYFALARLLLIDMAVSVLIGSTLCSFLLAVREPVGRRRRLLFWGVYVSAALATLAKGLIGFLLPGAVMFFWLLLFDQWHRLRPFYLPTGLLLFFAIAVPWHLLAAARNPTWAHYYFVHEHWERFTTTTHGRFRPWWFFTPIAVTGCFPWIGFLPGALRATLAGGWRARKDHADLWFFVVWAAFIFIFFSVSKSKLPPYILPVFPPIAVLLGGGLAHTTATGSHGNGGFIAFATSAVALTGAFVVVLVRPDLVSMDMDQASALRPTVTVAGAILMLGALFALMVGRRSGTRAALAVVAVIAFLFNATIGFATGDIQPAGTKEIARYMKEQVPADAPVYHYHDFFHDFTFYAERFVGTVEFHGDEMELLNDEAAQRSGRFLNEEEFRARWNGPERVFALVRKKKLAETRMAFAVQRKAHPNARPPVLIDRECRAHLMRETANYCLFSNRSN